MKNVIFFDDNEIRKNLLPITFTRPIARIRIGIDTIEEKWKAALGADATYSYLTATYLNKLFPQQVRRYNLLIAGHVIPNQELVAQVAELRIGEALMHGEELIAFYGTAGEFNAKHFSHISYTKTPPLRLHWLYNIFQHNAEVLAQDFKRITNNRKSEKLSKTNTIIGPSEQIFIEKGAVVEGAFLNTKEGPIYIGRDAEIMEGACIRGGFAGCENSKVKMGGKIYGATTLGPHCKVGGEVECTVMLGYSNKAHDGFLGDAVIGQWCNLGGGTTASNLKNNYTEIKLWNYPAGRFLKTGLQFCGLFMGDHSLTGVNTMINTATVLGVGVNIHGSGFPRNFIPSFSEGGASGFKDVPLEPFFQLVETMMGRRGMELTDEYKAMLTAIHEMSKRLK